MNMVNVGYASTNYYVIGPADRRLLIDVGWPGTLPKLLASLKRKGIAPAEVRYLLATHYHPDHAGLAQEVANQGVRLVVVESQVAAVPALKAQMKPTDGYVDIDLQRVHRLKLAESRAFLKAMEIAGEIIATPGHSADSVTLVLDDGAAFTGDLPGLAWARDEARAEVAQSWQAMVALGAKRVYPGHGPERPVESL